jgi:hypothetical protein
MMADGTGGDGVLPSVNPLANAVTRDSEVLALRVMEMPAVKQAMQAVLTKWKSIVGSDADAEARSLSDGAMREYIFHNVHKAVCGDPNYPEIVRTQMMPHEWFGMQVPGSRMAGDNPDTIYHMAPINGVARFEIDAQRFASPAADLSFTVTGNSGFTRPLGQLVVDGSAVGANGRFTITVGPEPADGRPHHITTARGAKFLFIRDTVNNWRDAPHALAIRRLDAPIEPPRTIDQIALDAAALLMDDVAETFWAMRIPFGFETNVLGVPFGTAAIGGLSTQSISYSHFELAADEAFVATFNDGGAACLGAVLFHFWLNSIDYVDRLGSLNRAQSIPNPDDTYTYVISARDPGIHNWLDTAGLRRVYLCRRWQGLAEGAAALTRASGRLVKFEELASVLPETIRRVTPAERAAQLADRRASYETRFLDR